MAKVTFKASGTARLKALVDQKPISFNGGTAEKELAAGEHSLTWAVIGQPGAKYTIEITAPASVKFSHSATLDASMRDAGVQWFTL